VRDYRLRLRYNVGSGEQNLQLSFVNVSDGHWHTATVDRVAQWVTLTLDTAEGREVNESLGDDRGQGELKVSQRGLLVGADVRFPSTNSAPIVNDDFDNGRVYSAFGPGSYGSPTATNVVLVLVVAVLFVIGFSIPKGSVVTQPIVMKLFTHIFCIKLP